jgi:nickel/cobalt transporter (NiCoT) family protein
VTRRRLARLAAAVLALHVVGVGLVLAHAGHHAGLVGAALLAYTLGVRHGFDADHIAAIDNTTRRLRAKGDRSITVGFFFALGHSSVVLVLTLVLALGAGSIPDFGGATGSIAGIASGTFLWIVGLLNLAVLVGIVRRARAMRAGRAGGRPLGDAPVPRGLLTRLGLDRLLSRVGRPWQMLPLGALFGLGFETATEVALLGLGTGATAFGLPLLAVLALPVLFAAGMTTVDTANGIAMGRAYDWAADRPARGLAYNFTITLLSVAVALGIGTLQLASAWGWAPGVDMEAAGIVIAVALIATWPAAMAAARLMRANGSLVR